ncbi:hypothetical protein ACLBWT_15675 [Paenibacillus sp. D51F]
MGVPDSFSFEGSLQQQVANGVAVQLTKAISGVIRAALLKLNIRRRHQRRFNQPSAGFFSSPSEKMAIADAMSFKKTATVEVHCG